MKDPTNMTAKQKYAYIFYKRQGKIFPGGRFHWISCLLGDIRTFLDGVEHYLQYDTYLRGRGGGNVSVPSLISTALELVSATYVGKTEYMDKASYNATENVRQFVIRFFPDNYKKFPLLIWDGIRNGIIHTFSPKPFKYQGEIVRFQFYVEKKTTSSFITKEDNTNYIRINVFELYDVLKSAIGEYCQELVKNEDLQDKFILAWESIENYARDITADKDKSREAKTLFSELNATRNHLVLWEGKLNKDINKNLEAKRVKSDSVANYLPPI